MQVVKIDFTACFEFAVFLKKIQENLQEQGNLGNDCRCIKVENAQYWPYLVPFKIPKLYKIPHHIEFFNTCMKY